MHTFQEKWVDLKEKLTKTKGKWAESGSIKEKKNRPKHEHNMPRPSYSTTAATLQTGNTHYQHSIHNTVQYIHITIGLLCLHNKALFLVHFLCIASIHSRGCGQRIVQC